MYIGVNELISLYKKEFDQNKKATDLAKRRVREQGFSLSGKLGNSRIEDEKKLVIKEWDKKRDNSKKVHRTIQERESKLNKGSIIGEYKKIEDGEIPIFPNIELDRNIHYYEKFLYNEKYKIIGYADHLYIDSKGYINIEDYKCNQTFTTNFTFEKNGLRFIEKFKQPINNLIDSKLVYAQLQSSLYMYLAWTLNPKLKFGNIKITHVVLNEDGESTGEEFKYDVPFLLDEIKLILKDYIKNKKANVI